MTDRELLALAAKAADIDLIDKALGSKGYVIDGARYWNPLTDDGDCARLEAAAQLGVYFTDKFVRAYYRLPDGTDKAALSEVYADHGGDKNKARRYASTKVAAEIGKTL